MNFRKFREIYKDGITEKKCPDEDSLIGYSYEDLSEWFGDRDESLRYYNEVILPRLSEKFKAIYKENEGFHDDSVKSININNFSSTISKKGKKEGMTVELTLYDANMYKSYEKFHILKYHNVSEIELFYTNSNSKSFDMLGEYLYSKFIAISDAELSQEILFKNDLGYSTLYVLFSDVSVKVLKVPKKRNI